MQSNLLANSPSQSIIATSPPQVCLPATSPCDMPCCHVTPIAISPCHVTSLNTSSCHITASNTQIQTDSNSFTPFVSCPKVFKECVNNGLFKDEGEKKKNFVKVKLVKNPNGAILYYDNTLYEKGEVIWVAGDAIIGEVGLDFTRNSPFLALGFEGGETGSGLYKVEVGIGGSSEDINGRANVEDKGIQRGIVSEDVRVEETRRVGKDIIDLRVSNEKRWWFGGW
ncbi:hypothetical protein Patl1_16670 [Pistacia atlantica]|uniref:Uncharacterized protein n=1 Tax=Pistacia atlantica TaxID=434234 RepID=A0ACC1BAE0_9ROSI|nr:hypothetical protein Patl1_16670 [Pistacia atlantica]